METTVPDIAPKLELQTKSSIDKYLSSLSTLLATRPSEPLIHQSGKVLKTLELISTTDRDAYRFANAHIYERLLNLHNQGAPIQAGDLYLLDPRTPEPIVDHELRHLDSLDALYADPAYSPLLPADRNNQFLSSRLEWVDTGNGIQFSLRGGVRFGFDFEKLALTIKDPEELVRLLQAAYAVTMAPQIPSGADFENVQRVAQNTAYTLESAGNIEGSMIANKMQTDVAKRSHELTVSAWIKQRQELQAIMNGSSASNLTAIYFSNYLEKQGNFWIIDRIADIDRVLKIMEDPKASKRTHNPLAPIMDAKMSLKTA